MRRDTILSLRRYRNWEKGEFVIIYGDTAWGGLDYSAAIFLSKTNLDTPLIYHAKVLASEMTPILHQEAEKIHDITGVQPVVCLERQNGGIAELERLATLNRLGKYRIYQQKTNMGTTDAVAETIKLGFDVNSATRPTMLSNLKEAIDNRLIVIPDKPLINEMFSFVVMQTSSSWKAQAEQGAHDDLIMSLAGAWQLYQTENPPVVIKRTRERPRKARLHV